VYGTLSKSDAGAAIGLDLLARRAELAGIPIIGIGGINDRNAGDVIRAGAVGAAVIGAILRANDPEHASRLFRASIDESLKERR
jgi:thiamine monophosphate synthase